MNANPLSSQGQTSESLQQEIASCFGGIPAFFTPALADSTLLAELWRQTQRFSFHAPLPEGFRAKLFALISLEFETPYCLSLQCCELHRLGLSGREILSLLREPPLSSEEVRGMGALLGRASPLVEWPSPDDTVERLLLRASLLFFGGASAAPEFSAALSRVLGAQRFAWLVAFFGYVRSCREWTGAHPHLSAENDAFLQARLARLLADEPLLRSFLQGNGIRASWSHSWLDARLAESEDFVRDLYEDSPDLHASVDLRTQGILRCNQTLANALGYSKSELLGRSVLSLYHPNSVGSAAYAFRLFLEVGQVRDVPLTMVRHDGSSLEVQLRISTVRALNGENDSLRLVWRDVSARNQSTRDQQFLLSLGEVLRDCESAEVLQEVATRSLAEYFKATRCWFSEVHMERDLCVTTYDYAVGLPSIRGQYAFSALSPDIRADLERGWMVVNCDTQRDRRTADYFESRYRPTGIFSCIVVPVLREGVLAAMFWLSCPEPRDWQMREVASMQSAAERAWLWLERLLITRKYRQIVEMTREGVWELDAEGRTTFVNPRMASMLGYSQREMLGKSLFAFTDEEGRRAAEHNLERRRNGISESHTFSFVRKDGSQLWTRIETDPLFDEKGSYSGAIAMVADATEQRAAELAMRASLREKEVLLKEIHHRVKNNLQITSSLLNLQAMRLSDPDARRMFAESQARVRSIALVHEALYESKDLSHVDFRTYVGTLLDNLSHSLSAAERGILHQIEMETVWLPVDVAIPCGLIINELVTNSLKHAFHGRDSGRLWVRLFQQPGGLLCLHVEDDGIGLPPSLDLRNTDSLGLDLVFTFAEQLSAEVEVQRTPHTLFQFVFRGEE